MRAYETVFVTRPDLTPEDYEAVVDRFAALIQGQGGEVTGIEKWGKRRLAYEIQKFHEGYYALIYFKGEPKVITELERVFRLSDGIIRHLIVLQDEDEGKQPRKVTRNNAVVGGVRDAQ